MTLLLQKKLFIIGHKEGLNNDQGSIKRSIMKKSFSGYNFSYGKEH